jgi:hypothetical protein
MESSRMLILGISWTVDILKSLETKREGLASTIAFV